MTGENDGCLRVAVIGVGANRWGEIAHIPALAVCPNAVATWVVTSNPVSAARAHSRLGLPATADLRRVLDDPDVT